MKLKYVRGTQLKDYLKLQKEDFLFDKIPLVAIQKYIIKVETLNNGHENDKNRNEMME